METEKKMASEVRGKVGECSLPDTKVNKILMWGME